MRSTAEIACLVLWGSFPLQTGVQGGIGYSSPIRTETSLALAYSPSGDYLICANGVQLEIWELPHRKKIWVFQPKGKGISSYSISPDGESLVIGLADELGEAKGPKVLLVELQTKQLHEFQVDRPAYHLSSTGFSADSAYFALGGMVADSQRGPSSTVLLIDRKTRKELLTFPTGALNLRSVAISPDRRHVGVGGQVSTEDSHHGQIQLWDTSTKQCRYVVNAHQGRMVSLVFSPDGKGIVSGGEDGFVRIWEVSTGRLRLALPEEGTEEIQCVAISPDGKLLAAGTRTGRLWIWALPSGRRLHTTRFKAGGIWSLAFSPRRDTLAIGLYDSQIVFLHGLPLGRK